MEVPNSLKLDYGNIYCSFDLVDIDWEFPNNQAANFVLLLQAIYNALHPNGYLVTIAVAVDNSLAASRYDIPNVEKYVDFINLVSYFSLKLSIFY